MPGASRTTRPTLAVLPLGCGARLALTCGSCGAGLRQGARFCLQCGHAVTAGTGGRWLVRLPRRRTPASTSPRRSSPPKAALEGERKQVTVLFADLKGSMELLADRDPEEARKTPRSRPRTHDGGRPPLRGHRQPGHGRRDHGALRRAAGPRGPRRCGRATRRCGCRSQSRSTRRVSSARTGCPSRSAWASTPARWSSAPSGPICTWITRRSVRRPTWPPAWSRWRRPARSCSPPRPCSSPKATCRSRPGAGRGQGPAGPRGDLRAHRSERARGPGSTRPPRGD